MKISEQNCIGSNCKAASSTASQNEVKQAFQFNDLRKSTLQRQQLKSAMQAPVQLYSLGTGTPENVTINGANGDLTFEQCRYNYVEYKKGDNKVDGTGTKSPASWAGWVKNKKGGRNATQLHVVNRRWGGLGGKADQNIVPGSPAENSHHLHEAEKKFDAVAFNNTSKAVKDAKYECWTTPKYGTSVDLKGSGLTHKDYGDPTLNVRITANSTATDYPVTDGAEGLTIEDGS